MHHDDWSESTWGWGQWRGGFAHMQQRRGIMPRLLLKVLEDGPKHGYDIIRHLEKQSHGFWRPSAGSVYPTLQLLEEQELVTSVEQDGKKVFELTDKGKEQAKENHTWWKHQGMGHQDPWKEHRPMMERIMKMRDLGKDLMGTLKTIVHDGSDEDMEHVKTILAETNEKLEKLKKKNK